eukprot:3181631-Amphidinium_carterae.1
METAPVPEGANVLETKYEQAIRWAFVHHCQCLSIHDREIGIGFVCARPTNYHVVTDRIFCSFTKLQRHLDQAKLE